MSRKDKKMIAIQGIAVEAKIYESEKSLVYRGKRSGLPVIVKVLKQDYPTPEEIRRYKQEYEITRQLKIEGVVKVYGLEPYQRTLVIILEDFGGASLRKLTGDRTFTMSEFLQIAMQTAAACEEIHRENIIHKDINPANIVFNPETGVVKIIDFGIATQLTRENPTLKNPDVLEGTLAYMSPEQTGRMNRSLDYRTDFYSLGATFYELLTGQFPFNSTDALELVHCHIAKQPVQPHEINPVVPKPLSDIVMKLMAKTAEERYQSAWGLKADLELCLAQLQENNISEFTLGSQDISDKFQIPQKLYGREGEVETLLAAFARVSSREESTTNKIEMMLVAGYSGIGKSALVQEIYKPITRERGYFISGKFDQFQRNIPYSAVVRAFQGLVRQLLTESAAELAEWRSQILAAVGANGQVIIDVIPEVELIVGEQPPVPELGPTESQNRLRLVFGNFIRVFCSPEHPLAIFLDDLQWADSATLKLIELMMTDEVTQYLFLIGAYRDNEVSPTHPFIITVENLRSSGAIVNQITLAPLLLEHVSQLLAETLHGDRTTVKPLAELVVRKTNGNPFFVNEFLQTLAQENLLAFNRDRLCWRWDMVEIEAMEITDNVVDLTIANLKKLPESTQQVLRLAACVGANFDLHTLAIVCERSPGAVFGDLTGAVQSGLLVPASELDEQLLIQDYKFRHDRIQQAAYALIDEAKKTAIHLQIGRLLWQQTAPEELSEVIFTIVDHLNAGVELVGEQAERDEIARLNLMAGKKAKGATAYGAAIAYLQVGLELLAASSWQTQYDLTLNLHLEAMEAAYLNANQDRVKQLGEVVIAQGKTLLDRLKAYDIKVQSYISQNEMVTALETGLQVLDLLGVSLSETPPTGLDFDRLIDLPSMTDPYKLAAMGVLMTATSTAYIGNPAMLPPIIFTMVSNSIQYGNSAASAHGYGFYGILLCGALGDIEAGYNSGKLALELLDKFEATELKCRVIQLFNVFMRHWKEPLKNTLAPLASCVQIGMEIGDLEYGCYSAMNYCSYSFFAGEALESVEEKYVNYIDLMSNLQQDFQLAYAKIGGQLVLNLLDRAENPGALTGKFFDEETYLPAFIAANNQMSIFTVYLAKLILFYLFQDYSHAVEYAEKATEYEVSVVGFLYVAEKNFYQSLSLLAWCSLSPGEQKQPLETVAANQAKMQEWAKYAAVNFQHKYDLVEAERSRVLGQNWQAAELYEMAIKGARENGYIQEEALAYELAAEFYLDRGIEKIAQTYLKEAHYGYTRWGAKAKVEDLEAKYPQLGNLSKSRTPISSTITTSHPTATSTGRGEALDLATVMKASQAISGEIVLSKLLEKLMKIIIENAGAQVGYLIWESQGKMAIEASSHVDDRQVTVLQSVPIDDRVPASLLNYVTRTEETVVQHDAVNVGKFTNDPYIQGHQTKSILCAPLINQGKLIGIVYLENNLTTGAFTPERVEVLQILSGQAAIAIENAQFYHTLEEKVADRTAQLAAANREITKLNERLKAENLRMSAELEVTQKLQQMVLPNESELEAIEGLEIAGFMEPADEVGGDYYDVLQQDGKVKLAIGDVTGHGLESGILMIMTQTAVRSLLANNETDPVKFLDALNRTIYGNVERMNSDKNLTLCLLDYAEGVVSLSGQHEDAIVVRADGTIELIDTMDLGFPIGLDAEIADFIAETSVQLCPGDGIVLYTDGITEAEDLEGVQYGQERLCEVISENWQGSAVAVRQAVVDDVRRHMGAQKVYDDITLLVLKQK